jgi:hypothetical protein
MHPFIVNQRDLLSSKVVSNSSRKFHIGIHNRMPHSKINGSNSQHGCAAVTPCTCMQGCPVQFSIGTPTVMRFLDLLCPSSHRDRPASVRPRPSLARSSQFIIRNDSTICTKSETPPTAS